MSLIDEPVLNIIVVGFHHKKGCQVEHCYPEVIPGKPTELPTAWRYLPALALPDGSHNYLSDTIYFHLPGVSDPEQTLFAISCFRQIPLEQVVQKTEDMTRSSVQKSVCVVCRAPLFGRLAVKMQLVVSEWFRQGDFSQTKLLEDAFNNINRCSVKIEQTLEGLHVRQMVESWRHKLVLLLKLVLLRRKVVMYGCAAGPLSSALLSLVSLFPLTMQSGLTHAANITLTRPLSPNSIDVADEAFSVLDKTLEQYDINNTNNINGKQENLSPKESRNLMDDKDVTNSSNEDDDQNGSDKDTGSDIEKNYSPEDENKTHKLSEAQQSPTMTRDMSVDGLCNLTSQVDPAECGFPIPLFEDGYLCLPYLSLQYLDLLADPAVEGFLVGASNVLFKQKRQLYDILVELNDLRIETADVTLRKQLALSTEDLRFADHVVRHAPTQSDEWIRDQFTSYLIYLLRTSLLPEGSRELDSYNSLFMAAFKSTPAYMKWLENTNDANIEAFLNLTPAHPFGGQLSVADMKLKLAHTMSSTEGGRKVTAAVASTGRAVATTSRAVGGALSQARGALSGWWTALTAPTDTHTLPGTAEPHTAPSQHPASTEPLTESPDHLVSKEPLTKSPQHPASIEPLTKSLEQSASTEPLTKSLEQPASTEPLTKSPLHPAATKPLTAPPDAPKQPDNTDPSNDFKNKEHVSDNETNEATNRLNKITVV